MSKRFLYKQNNNSLLFTILLFSFIIPNSTCSTNSITVEYDPETNQITYKGQTFQSISTQSHSNTLSHAEFCFDLIIVFSLTLFAGAMSGLTVGYLSIDDLIMDLKIEVGTPLEKKYAQRVSPIIKHHHWLLVTLLLCNSAAMEALPLVLNRLVSEFMAIVISVTLVLFFGEIIPQALCTGPNQLPIASFLAPLTISLMYITSPLSFPLGKLIDFLVGEHSKSRFCNRDLKGLIELHTIDAIKAIKEHENLSTEQSQLEEFTGLTKEQAQIMQGAFEINEQKVKEMMTPLNKACMIDYNKAINSEEITKWGYSRLPVYSGSRNNVIGILRMKQLVGVNIKSNKTLRELNVSLSHPLVISPEMSGMDLLNRFREGKSHMAFITNEIEEMQRKFGVDRRNSYKESLTQQKFFELENEEVECILGLITLEDVIEKMIKVDILDEDDYKKKNLKIKKQKKKEEDFRKGLTKKISQSFLRENKEKLNSLIGSSLVGYDNDNYNDIGIEGKDSLGNYHILKDKDENI